MATKFIEPGGDATFNVALTNAGGFYRAQNSSSIVTDIVHGTHVKSIKILDISAYGAYASPPDGVIQDTGTRVSHYIYLNAIPVDHRMFQFITAANVFCYQLGCTTAGVLRMYQAGSTQIGTDGPTLVTGRWYRISIAYTVTSTTVNRFEVFVDGVSAISVTNATVTTIGATRMIFGHQTGNLNNDVRLSDMYIDNSSALTDTGDIYVTAKRPFSNGTSVQFTTQIGAGGSGYGSGHTPQVNERALSVTNGWSIQNAAKQTEEYSIEGAAVGDIDISATTIVDFVGWVYAKVGVASTGNIIVNGVATNISVLTTALMFTKVVGSTTYPAGNTDIGMDTNTVNQLFSLLECGIMFAYIAGSVTPPATTVPTPTLALLGVG